MQATETLATAGFYSDLARELGGRNAALNALDDLVDDLEVLVVDCEQKIVELNRVIQEREEGVFPGRPPSRVEATLALSVLLDDLNYLRLLRLASIHNLQACTDRRRQLRP